MKKCTAISEAEVHAQYHSRTAVYSQQHTFLTCILLDEHAQTYSSPVTLINNGCGNALLSFVDIGSGHVDIVFDLVDHLSLCGGRIQVTPMQADNGPA